MLSAQLLPGHSFKALAQHTVSAAIASCAALDLPLRRTQQLRPACWWPGGASRTGPLSQTGEALDRFPPLLHSLLSSAVCRLLPQEDDAERRAKILLEVKRHLGSVLVEVTDALLGEAQQCVACRLLLQLSGTGCGDVQSWTAGLPSLAEARCRVWRQVP